MSRFDWRKAFAVEDGSAPPGAMPGTPGDDRFRGLGGDFDMSQGGDDRLRLKGSDDTVYFGAAFTGDDKVNGGKGFDVVTLDGDYSHGVEVQADSLVKIEQLVLEGGSYVMTGVLNFEDSLGVTLVDARTLGQSESLDLDVSSLGELRVIGGAGDDVLHTSGSGTFSQLAGFDGDDTLIGGSGPALLIGGAGADRIVMGNADDVALYGASDSTRQSYDTIENFAASGGRIRLLFDSDTTDDDLTFDFHLGKTAERVGDVVSKYDAVSDETVIKVFTDHDKIADLVIHVAGDVHLTPADFIFG